LICGGCGRGALLIDRGTAVEVIEDLTGRLVRLSTDVRVVPGSAVDTLLTLATAQVCRTLTGLDAHLGDLSPFDGSLRPRPPTSAEVTAPSVGDPTPTGRSGLLDCAARLAWTISTLGDQCWRDRSTVDGVCPAELVWTALHDATHAVEDVELCVPPAKGGNPATTAPSRSALVV
jgi:hypothetical protein